MEENEKEVVKTEVEETESTEVEEETNDETPTLEDYQRLKKERETLLAQKEHWKKKATQSKPLEQTETLKTNNEYLTRDEAVLLAKGYDEDDLARLNVLAKAEGKKLNEVVNDEMFIAWKVKAQLGSSKSSTSKMSKPVSEMTPEEHKAYWQSLQK
jgi:hypothetical protein